ncbi:MAG: DMT family transporter [Oscillospiraceae bacterium]|nr:DMT family transporter [Oscillospiraceae bacterium]
MKKSGTTAYAAEIIAGGCLWGTMGLFRRHLGDMGLSTFEVIFIRCGVAALCYALTLLLTGKEQFRVKLKDAWCFIGSGLCSLLFFCICYFQAMTLMSLSAAAILLYTAPCFVILLSGLLFKEKITPVKITAMLLAFAGCCLVSGIVGDSFSISLVGVLYGLGSGLGYALYSIFGKFAMARGYRSNTINLYACLLAALGACCICGPMHPLQLMVQTPANLFWCLATGVITAYLPYMLYTHGLSGTEAGKASVMASVEPVVATIVGMIAFHETLSFSAVLGIVLVLGGICLINLKTGKARKG